MAIAAVGLATTAGAAAKPRPVTATGAEAHGERGPGAKPGKGRRADGPQRQVGARTLGDPLFPQIGNGGYDVSHYEIELDYDPSANAFLPGTRTTITAVASQKLRSFSLDFQDLEVSKVTVNGRPARFAQREAKPPLSDNPDVTQPMKLIVEPAPPARPKRGREFVVEVSYAGEPERVTDPDTSSEGWIQACYPLDPPQTCDGAFVVNEPIGAQSWFPANNYPTDKASFETIITVPEAKTALGVGELVARTANGDGTATWRWAEDDPTATYLTTATVGDFDYSEDSLVEASTGRTLQVYNAIDSSATAEQQDAIEATLARAPGQLNFLSDLLGPYPFDSHGAVADRAAGVGYALEVQTKAHYAGNFVTGAPGVNINTQLHEIAHQWLGNSVSPASWQEIWFNEGWATWLTWHWAHEENGAASSPADQFESNYTPGSKWNVPPADLGTPANLFSGFPVYTRSAMMIEGYRQILGDDDRFFAFARELLERFGAANVSREQFVDLALEMSELSGGDRALLADYFDQWLFGEAQPTIVPEDFQ